MESVILSSPILVVLYLLAMALQLFGAVKKAGFPVTAIALLLFVGTTAYALIAGATLYETGAVAVLFFSVQLISSAGRK